MICNYCKKDLPLSEFYNWQKRKMCKKCSILRRKAYFKGVQIKHKGNYGVKQQAKGDINRWIE